MVNTFATSSVATMLRTESPRAPWGATFVLVSAVVSPSTIAEMDALHRAGRPVALISLAAEDPPRTAGTQTYHLPPSTPAFAALPAGAAESIAALDAAGLTTGGKRPREVEANPASARSYLSGLTSSRRLRTGTLP
jgi:hypothetical protein